MSDVERFVMQLYLSRKAAKDAKAAHRKKAAEVGDCSKADYERDRCWREDMPFEEWCDSCKARQPLWEDYQEKAYAAGAALAKIMRAGRSLSA